MVASWEADLRDALAAEQDHRVGARDRGVVDLARAEHDLGDAVPGNGGRDRPGRHERGGSERQAPDRHAARRDGPDAARDGGGRTRKHPYVRAVFATAGDQRQHQPHRAKLNVLLLPKDERDIPIDTTFEELRESILARVTGRLNR